jgi:hypothetical protein
MGHDVANPTKFRHWRSSASRATCLAAVLEETAGADDSPTRRGQPQLTRLRRPCLRPASPGDQGGDSRARSSDRAHAPPRSSSARQVPAAAVAIAADHGMPASCRPAAGTTSTTSASDRAPPRLAAGPSQHHRRRQQRDPPRHGEAAIAEGSAGTWPCLEAEVPSPRSTPRTKCARPSVANTLAASEVQARRHSCSTSVPTSPDGGPPRGTDLRAWACDPDAGRRPSPRPAGIATNTEGNPSR